MNVVAASSELGKIIVLVPAFVVGLGIVAAVTILLGRAFVDSARSWGHPRLLAAGAVALFAVVVLLTWLGVSLPRE